MQKSVLKFITFLLLILLAKRQESFFFLVFRDGNFLWREFLYFFIFFSPLMGKVVINYYNIPEVAYRDKLF